MSRSKTLTKTIAVKPNVHAELAKLQKNYNLQTINDMVEKLISEFSDRSN